MQYSLLFLLLLVFAGCGGNNPAVSAGADLFSVNYVKTSIEYLASDKLQGREAATFGEKAASEFLARQLQASGIKPFGDSGTYFQNFKVKLKYFNENSVITFSNDKNTRLKIGEDFARIQYIIPDSLKEAVNTEIVFAGYGISSPEDGYDDYKDLDVNGKAVLVYAGSPAQISNPEQYLRSYAKLETAMSKGASAFLVIPNDYALKWWDIYKGRSTSKSFVYEEEQEAFPEVSISAALLSEEASAALLMNEQYSFNVLRDKAKEGAELPHFILKTKAGFDMRLGSEYADVRNVVGIIEGSEDSLKNEYISIGAHYDHEGIKNGVIYNGANDNASGTAALLETSRVLATSKENKRPVIVIFFTAEEKGLIGSKYFTSNSPIIDNIIVNINLDMVGSGSIDTLYSVGSGRLSSELYNLVNNVNKNSVNFVFDYQFDDPDDPERIYYRSDHYQFAKKGIPVVFFTCADSTNYHKPSDDAEFINFEKVTKTARLVSNIAMSISNLEHKLTKDEEIPGVDAGILNKAEKKKQ